jgi:hypothetical protein
MVGRAGYAGARPGRVASSPARICAFRCADGARCLSRVSSPQRALRTRRRPANALLPRLDERRALSAWLTRVVLDLARDLRDGRPVQHRVVRGKRIRLVACGASVHVERQHYRSVTAPSIPRQGRRYPQVGQRSRSARNRASPDRPPTGIDDASYASPGTMRTCCTGRYRRSFLCRPLR